MPPGQRRRGARWSAIGPLLERGWKMRLDRSESSPQQIEEVFHQVCRLHGAAREAALSHACGADQSLRIAVEQLLAAAERAAGRAFWKDPAIVNEAKSTAFDEDSTTL